MELLENHSGKPKLPIWDIFSLVDELRCPNHRAFCTIAAESHLHLLKISAKIATEIAAILNRCDFKSLAGWIGNH